MKETIFENWNNKTINIHNNSAIPHTLESIAQNLKKIHTIAVDECLKSYTLNPIISQPAPDVNQSSHPSPICTLCKSQEHTIQHLFSCKDKHHTDNPGRRKEMQHLEYVT